jgi:hypothetical protein
MIGVIFKRAVCGVLHHIEGCKLRAAKVEVAHTAEQVESALNENLVIAS